ncbi:uncharacterized protein CDAR_316051 [Caerostris darwini]|uniref:Uncharacterized protein n=1 Tax=Caerostris darwini TaxID=1538125 RepID=A0AAV4MAK6_9ARAC|nr:uncharacterized protein CDAR_316051 [Caerostris darwini]
MDLHSPASLRLYSSVSVTSALFCNKDLFKLCQAQKHRVGWVAVQDCVAQQVKFLGLPQNVEVNIQELVQPLGDQIRRWLCRHEIVLRKKANLYNKLIWTAHALIDYKKTAENILRSEELDPLSRFNLACINAIVDYINLSYANVKNALDKDIKRCHRKNRSCSSYPAEVKIWISFLAQPDDEESITNVFQTVIKNGNTALARHFITKIKPDRKPELIKQLTVDVLSKTRSFNPALLLFLLSQMSNQQIMEVFIENAENSLLRFLEWPLHNYFMNLANKLWEFMSGSTFLAVVQAIVQRIIQHHAFPEYLSFENPYIYVDIFKSFWLCSPNEYRRLCISDMISPVFSYVFSPHNLHYAMSHLFNDVSSLEKIDELFFSNAYAVLHILSNDNKAAAIKSLMQNYLPSETLRTDFEDQYQIFTARYLDIYYGNIEIFD